MSHTRPPYRSDNSPEALTSIEAEHQAQLVRAWLTGYGTAMAHLAAELERRPARPSWWRRRLSGGTRQRRPAGG